MARISINEAAKRFDVSRPTLLKHLKSGQISGVKDDGKGWQIDTSELARAYQSRTANDDNALHDALPSFSSDIVDNLKAENERLRSDLAVAQALADERSKRLDQFAALLSAPQTRRRWWQFGAG